MKGVCLPACLSVCLAKKAPSRVVFSSPRLHSALRCSLAYMAESTPLDNLDRSLEEPAGSASKLEQLEVLVAVLVLVLVALLCVWLWRLRRWWREQRERHVKVLDEIEMCEPASEPSVPCSGAD